MTSRGVFQRRYRIRTTRSFHTASANAARCGGLRCRNEPGASRWKRSRARPARAPNSAGSAADSLSCAAASMGAQPQLGRGPGHAGQEQGVRLVEGHPGEPGPVAVEQLVTAAAAAVGVDRHPGRAERLDIAVDGAYRDLELGRQLGGGRRPRACRSSSRCRSRPARMPSNYPRNLTDAGR